MVYLLEFRYVLRLRSVVNYKKISVENIICLMEYACVITVHLFLNLYRERYNMLSTNTTMFMMFYGKECVP